METAPGGSPAWGGYAWPGRAPGLCRATAHHSHKHDVTSQRREVRNVSIAKGRYNSGAFSFSPEIRKD